MKPRGYSSTCAPAFSTAILSSASSTSCRSLGIASKYRHSMRIVGRSSAASAVVENREIPSTMARMMANSFFTIVSSLLGLI